MDSLQNRVQRLESTSRGRLVPLLIAVGLVGGLLGAAASDTVSRQLLAGSVVVVNEDGRPVITLGSSAEGNGRVFIHNAEGDAMLVLRATATCGSVDVLGGEGHRLASIGDSPTGDGMVVINAAGGEPLVRAGRWDAEATRGDVLLGPAVVSETSTP